MVVNKDVVALGNAGIGLGSMFGKRLDLVFERSKSKKLASP